MQQPDTEPARCLICGADMKQKPCPECAGTGTVHGGGERCDECNALGWVWFCPRNPDHGIRRNVAE